MEQPVNLSSDDAHCPILSPLCHIRYLSQENGRATVNLWLSTAIPLLVLYELILGLRPMFWLEQRETNTNRLRSQGYKITPEFLQPH